jgi:hypothetical protein
MVSFSIGRTRPGRSRASARCLTVLLAALASPQALSASPQSGSESSSCATTDGRTVCLQGSGSLSCTTTNGSTRCEGPDGLMCEDDADGALTCTPPAGGRCKAEGSRITCTREAG